MYSQWIHHGRFQARKLADGILQHDCCQNLFILLYNMPRPRMPNIMKRGAPPKKGDTFGITLLAEDQSDFISTTYNKKHELVRTRIYLRNRIVLSVNIFLKSKLKVIIRREGNYFHIVLFDPTNADLNTFGTLLEDMSEEIDGKDKFIVGRVLASAAKYEPVFDAIRHKLGMPLNQHGFEKYARFSPYL